MNLRLRFPHIPPPVLNGCSRLFRFLNQPPIVKSRRELGSWWAGPGAALTLALFLICSPAAMVGCPVVADRHSSVFSRLPSARCQDAQRTCLQPSSLCSDWTCSSISVLPLDHSCTTTCRRQGCYFTCGAFSAPPLSTSPTFRLHPAALLGWGPMGTSHPHTSGQS